MTDYSKLNDLINLYADSHCAAKSANEQMRRAEIHITKLLVDAGMDQLLKINWTELNKRHKTGLFEG